MTVKEDMIRKFGPGFDYALKIHKQKEKKFLENILKTLDKKNNIYSNETCSLINEMETKIKDEIERNDIVIKQMELREKNRKTKN